jgi:hypothetical protein
METNLLATNPGEDEEAGARPCSRKSLEANGQSRRNDGSWTGDFRTPVVPGRAARDASAIAGIRADS